MKKNLLKGIVFLWVILYAPAALCQGPAPDKIKGVNTISVSTLSGEVVEVRVPNDIRPGDQITGSVVQPAKASGTLEGSVIEVENKKTDVAKKVFTFLVPAGLIAIPFIIKNNKGETIGKADISLPSNTSSTGGFVFTPASGMTGTQSIGSGNFIPPTVCQPGDPLVIPGNFDGNSANTTVQIHNIPCEVIAESPRSSWVGVPPNTPVGPTGITISENGVTKTVPIQVVSINMSADKLQLQKGEKTTVRIAVSGLDGLAVEKKGYDVVVNNLSPGSVSFVKEEGTNFTKTIDPKKVSNGQYSFTTSIVGGTAGKYTLTSGVASDWDRYREESGRMYQSALDGGMPSAMAQKYLDNVLAAYHPGTSPGGCRPARATGGGVFSCTSLGCTDACHVFSIPKRGGLDEDPKDEGISPTPAAGRIYFCSCTKWQWW